MDKFERIAKEVAEHYATCDYCHRKMGENGCKKHWYIIDGEEYEAVKFGDPMEKLPDDITVCHDCGAKLGEYHHPGCDMERCPKCGKQLIGFHGCDVSDAIYMDE